MKYIYNPVTKKRYPVVTDAKGKYKKIKGLWSK